MEERIGFYGVYALSTKGYRLNPYCNGRKNRMLHHSNQNKQLSKGLNPYCNGRKNRILL